jgi:hypothetical protein
MFYVIILELVLPTKSTYEVEETTRGITVLEEFDSDQPPTYQNQPPNADILDKVNRESDRQEIKILSHINTMCRSFKE